MDGPKQKRPPAETGGNRGQRLDGISTIPPGKSSGLSDILNDPQARAVLAEVRNDHGLPPEPPTVEDAPEFTEQEIHDMQGRMDGCSREDAIQKLRELSAICETTTLEGIKDRILPPPDQILVDFADRGDKCFLIGTSKSRKSFSALQIALHIVSGGKARMPFEVGRA